MTFAGFGSSGSGFGSNNQQQQPPTTGFGGFGTPTNTASTGFGAPGNTGFGVGGSNTGTGGGLFGGGMTVPTTGFGTSTGFGTNTQQTSAFGTGPGFGTPTTSSGGGLFGNVTAAPGPSTGFGGFGATPNNATTSGFGQPSGGGLFGQPSQTGFGSTTNNANASPFGGTANITTGFGNTPQAGFGGALPSSGFGSSVLVQNQGTGGTPFQAHMEKDTASNQNTAYQSITFQQPYSNYSFEELRLADYSQGRKYGNQNGQAGAFGTSTGFGNSFGNQQPITTTGFGGTSSGGLFGQASTPATGFGAAQQTTAFGQATVGASGLFGQPKPATSNLFGTAPSTTTQVGGGLFGNSGAAAFGQTPANGASTAGGLFGQQPQQKSLFGGGPTTGFGSLNTGGFGQTPTGTTGNSLFGQPQNTLSGFGTAQPQQSSQSSSPFGGFGTNQAQIQPQAQTQTGGIFGGAFGTNQTQPKSLFGGTGTSLFGQNPTQPQPQQGGGLFGGNTINNQQQSTNLFGQPKPATSNLFGGNSVNNAPLGGGLFSNLNNNNQAQQTQGTSLFGQPQNQQKPPLFGLSTTNTGLGNGLFSNLGQGTNNQQTGGNSLFGPNNPNQQSQMGNSIFSNSQPSQLQQQQPQQLTTSIMSSNPYGNEHLFASLGTPPPAVGPLATPLNSSQRPRRHVPIPQHMLNPAASVRMITPQKRTGFGFSYSSYGTPGSAAGTPNGYSNSLFGSGSFGRTLGKSLSTSNLRSSINAEDSILNLNAFSANGSRTYGSSGSMRKLKIDRSLRTDLFGGDGGNENYRSSPLKKKVSFDSDTSRKHNGESLAKDSEETRSDERESATPSAEEQGLLRSARPSRSAPRSRAPPASSEMEQVKGNELAIVPEDSPAPAVPVTNSSNSAVENLPMNQADQLPGEYWMKPSKAELRKLDRKEKSKLRGLIVGREGCGTIEFGDVDLNGIDIDRICGDIVRLETRSATVYLDHAQKPPNGKGMNVPSLVTLQNSWPRAKGGRLPVYERKGPKFDKHIQRLQRVSGTEFVGYVAETGQWIFRVPHFSTYALDYSDDADTSMLSAPPDTPTPKSQISSVHRSQVSPLSQNGTSVISITSSTQNSTPDDTFEFRRTRALPGAFDDNEDLGTSANTNGTTWTGQEMSDVDSTLNDVDDSAPVKYSQMTGSFSNLDGNMDVDVLKNTPKFNASAKPKSILKAGQYHRASFGTPLGAQSTVSGNWADQLRRTLSPKKQDRQTLRDTQGPVFKERQQHIMSALKVGNNRNTFATSIDVMNSLFGHDAGRSGERGKTQGMDGEYFQSPHAKRSKTHDDDDTMIDPDKAFHNAFKTSWAADETLASFASGAVPTMRSGMLVSIMDPVIVKSKETGFARFAIAPEKLVTPTLKRLLECTSIEMADDVPHAFLSADFTLEKYALLVEEKDTASKHERTMWELVAILFGDINHVESEVDQEQQRKERFSKFWKCVVDEATAKHAESVSSAEEKAVIYLSGYDIWQATEALLKGRDFRLGTIIAQIGGDQATRDGMKGQIDEWRRANVLSEMSRSIRVLYELVAGNTCVSEGKRGSGPENRAEDINISQRFGLDWRRAFGLKFWYGITWDQEIHEAIDQYTNDLIMNRELVKPIPWFAEQKIDTGSEVAPNQEQQDILWGLLKIYAVRRTSGEQPVTRRSLKLQDMLSPQNLAGNAFDARLSFQLYTILSALDISDFPEDERDRDADLLTTDLAFQLAASSTTLCDAVFISLHLSQPAARRSAIDALLRRHANAIGETKDTCSIYRSLSDKFMIPEKWIWAAKALYAKTVQHDDVEEVRCLLKAEELDAAHARLRTVVGPRCVIEEDSESLRGLLEAFARSGATGMLEWEEGGAVYADFVSVLDAGAGHREGKAGRLLRSLERIKGMPVGLQERVAMHEMREVAARVLREAQIGLGAAERLDVGLVEDQVLRNVETLSKEYYARVLVV